MNNRTSKIGICLLLILLYGSSLKAQQQSKKRYSFDFRGEPLSKVLEDVAQQTGMNMVYDPQLVQDISIYKRIRNQPVPELLKNVLEETPLDFVTLSSGTFVIVETVNAKPSFGTYFGKVVDSRTGDPLPGASVMLADASGGTSTSRNGDFSINHLMTGTYTIIFSYIGYEPVYKTIEIDSNQELQQKVALRPKPVDFIPIVVTGHLPQMPFNGNKGQTVQTGSPLEPNGRMQDAIRSLTLFPGIQYGLPMTELHLQGGQLGEHRILLDGVPVYNPYSFGKMFSAFSPFAINKIELHKAGYGAPQGSQIAGLINMKHDINSNNQNSAMFEADPLSLNLRGDLHFTGNDDNSRLDIMTAARSNYWDIYQEPTLQQTLQQWDALDPLVANLLLGSDEEASLYEPREHSSDVEFYDLHFASRYQIDPYRTLSSSFYMGKNFVSTDLLREAPDPGDLPKFLYARDEYLWNNLMGQVSYDHLVSPRLDVHSQISFSSNRFRHRYLIGTNENPNIPQLSMGTLDAARAAYDYFNTGSVQNRIPTQRNTNRIQHAIFRTSGTYSFTPHFNIDAGVQLDFVKSQVDMSDLFYLTSLSDQQSSFYSGYLDNNWRLGAYWKISAGSRFTLASSTNRVYAEPRASIQFDHPKEVGGIGYWSARLSGGLYRQFINQYEITNPGPTSLVPSLAVWSHAGTSKVPKAWHLSGSFQLEPTKRTVLNIETFYKWQPTAYTVSYNHLLLKNQFNYSDFNSFAEATEMETVGAGIRLHHSTVDSKLKLIFGYDYSYNRINLESQFGHAVPTPWNEPHRFQFRALWRILPQISTVVKWQTILGRTWGFRQAYYNYLFYESGDDFGNYHFDSPGNDRLSPYHQLDLSLIYKPSFKAFDMEVRLDLVNLLDRHNPIDWSLQPQNPGTANANQQYSIKKRTMPGFSPSLSIQFDI